MSDKLSTHWVCGCDDTDNCHCHNCLMEKIDESVVHRDDYENVYIEQGIYLSNSKGEIGLLKDRLITLERTIVLLEEWISSIPDHVGFCKPLGLRKKE